MNNDNFEKFIEELESIKMTSQEKNKIHSTLVDFARDYTPATKSPYYNFMHIAQRSFAVAFMIVIGFGSISHLATKDALPGDTLYPVKLAHEDLTAATINSQQKKITYEIKRTEKRIQEATVLAQKEELDEMAQESIGKEIQEQAQKVQEQIKEIKNSNPEEALLLNAELKSTIKINSQALRKVTTPEPQEQNEPEIAPAESISVQLDEIIINKEDQQELSTPDVVEIDTQNLPESTTQNNQSNPVQEEDEENEDTSHIINESEGDTLDTVPEKGEGEGEGEGEGDKERSIEPSKVILELSTAASILDLIEEDVRESEELEIEITEALTKEERITTTPTEEVIAGSEPQIDQNEMTLEVDNSTELDYKEVEKQEDDLMEQEMGSLRKITELRNKIKKIKGDDITFHKQTETTTMEDGSIVEDIIFDEEALRNQAQEFIEDGKNKQAFVVLQKIFEYFQEKSQTSEIELELGITIDKKIAAEKPTSTETSTEENLDIPTL